MKTIVNDEDKHFQKLVKKFPKMTHYGYTETGFFVFVGEEKIAFVGKGCI